MHASPRRPLRPSRLGWAFGLCAAIATAGVLLRLEGDACAFAVKRPAAAVKAVTVKDNSGRAIYYVAVDGSMRCSFGSVPADGLYASLSAHDYGTADVCGAYLDVFGPGGTKVRVQVIDRCQGCSPGTLDIGRTAFGRLAPIGRGRIDVRWRQVRDPFASAPRLAFRMKAGSDPDWLGLLVLNHANGLRSVEVRSGDGWRPLRRGLDNHWALSRPGAGPFTVRVTDVYGNRREITSVRLAPGETQRSKVQMYDGPARPMATTQTSIPSPPPSAVEPSPSPPQRESPRCG
ncbi:expansin EXLX1 family cellulose-binding protein [Actinocorallia longicatena]|uniref:Expansin (Peptidoglycan-binding protein) n=1 Tax=Actinocorallia longicatena TaxID=111803 RepID=A0ABP6QJ88_9ACTN